MEEVNRNRIVIKILRYLKYLKFFLKNIGNPEKHANFFSKLTFSWLNPLLLTGYKRPLEVDDLYEIPQNYKVY